MKVLIVARMLSMHCSCSVVYYYDLLSRVFCQPTHSVDIFSVISAMNFMFDPVSLLTE